MTKEELVQLVTDDLTVSGSLSLNLNTKEIERIIDVEKNWFHREYRQCVEPKCAVMNPWAFRTDAFRKSRSIQLPECVWGIDEFREIRDGGRLFGLNDPDLRMERVMGSDLWLSPFSSDVITTRTVSYSWFDLARSFTLTDIQFTFNQNTHRIYVKGHDPIAPVFIRALVAIDDGDLYEDYYFQRWVIARCKMQMHRVLKTFEYVTIGGVNITSMYGEQGKEEMTELKETISKLDMPDWFLMFQ